MRCLRTGGQRILLFGTDCRVVFALVWAALVACHLAVVSRRAAVFVGADGRPGDRHRGFRRPEYYSGQPALIGAERSFFATILCSPTKKRRPPCFDSRE